MTTSTSNPTTTTTTTTTSTSTPTKRKSSTSESTPKTIHFAARTPTWTYLKLQLINHDITSTTPTLDPLTARTYLSAALSQFLGLTGTAIPIDILKVSTEHRTPTVWTRVPRDDASAVVAALSSWIGGSTNTGGGSDTSAGNVAWRVCAKGNYLGALVQGSGSELFVP